MKFLTFAVPATLVMGVVAMPVPSTSKAARLSGENLFDGLAKEGGLSGFLSGVHLPFLNPSPKKDDDDADEDPGDDKGPGAGDVAAGAAPDDDNNGDGPADPIYGSEDSAGVGAGTQDGAERQ
ncbi:hypothetical protein AnigIFM50267_005359 [Aspergillus niger]|nr:hypothetical protein AnigIFM50267_005359 [Aspergillus niger]